MAVTVQIACSPFVKHVINNEFTEGIIYGNAEDWWYEALFESFRKPGIGEHMPPIPPDQEYITIQLPEKYSKAGRIYIPLKFRESFLRAIEKYGRNEIPKRIQRHINTGKYLVKDCILMALEAYGLADDDKEYYKYHRAYYRNNPVPKECSA